MPGKSTVMMDAELDLLAHRFHQPPLRIATTPPNIAHASCHHFRWLRRDCAYVFTQWRQAHGTRSGLHAQHSVTFCGELEGMAPHLSCGQTDSRMRYVSSPDEVWTA